MNKSKIEYLDKCWNFYTGCLHWQNGVCPVGVKCWAYGRAKRFSKGDFTPRLHPEMLLDPLKLQKPTRIGVCFTGDLFGDWVDPSMEVRFRDIEQRDTDLTISLRDYVIDWVVKMRSQHQFFFLTKAPQNYHKWGKFPDNAWVGASVNYAVPMGMALTELYDVDAKHKWLSIEPLMGEIKIGNLRGVEWLVIGGWSTGKKNQPKLEWIKEIVEAADKSNIPVFEKNNLNCCAISDYPELLDAHGNLRQEFPSAVLNKE